MPEEPDRLTLVLRALLPREMADSFESSGLPPEDIADLLKQYLAGDPDSQADMAAFHQSDGPAKVNLAMLKADIADVPVVPVSAEECEYNMGVSGWRPCRTPAVGKRSGEWRCAEHLGSE